MPSRLFGKYKPISKLMEEFIMKKLIISIIVLAVMACSTGCNVQKTVEKCVAVDEHTFKTADGNLFQVSDNLIVSETYVATFMSYDNSTRKDDVIVDFCDLEIWELGQDYMN